MKFDVECVRNCLVSNEVVFSVRGYYYKSNECDFEGRLYKRSLIGVVECKEDLSDYVKLSGFDNISDWWNKIVDFCGVNKKYLYVIVLGSRQMSENGGQ